MKFKKTARGWRVDFYHPLTSQRVRKVFPTLSQYEAKQMFEVLRGKMLVNGGLLPKTSQNSPLLATAVREYVVDYSEIYKSKSSQVTDRTSLNGLLEISGNVSVFQLSRENVSSYIRRQLEEFRHKASSVNRRLNSIKHFLKWCFDRGWMPVDISGTIKHVKGASRECRALSNEELDKILEHSTETLRLQIQIAATWGLRAGEVAALEWNWFDFETNRLSIGKTASFTTKSGKSKTLPLPPRLREVILEQRKVSGRAKWVFPNQWGTGPIKSHVISTAWRRAWLVTGLEYIRFHDLRATVGTRLAEVGLGDASVGRILGHQSPNMARKYSQGAVAPIRSGIEGIENSLPASVLGQNSDTIVPMIEMASS